jgi:NADH:ubiquinone oxidoreductase subunit 3 (subunit A)
MKCLNADIDNVVVLYSFIWFLVIMSLIFIWAFDYREWSNWSRLSGFVGFVISYLFVLGYFDLRHKMKG